jgi:uncharacterized protein (DUF302 family)
MSTKNNGITQIFTHHSVNEVVERIKSLLNAAHVTLFATIDHSGEAEKAGLKMPNTKLLIFGNPQSGTPLMQASPSSALDLPLKILVAEDFSGQVTLSYNSAAYLQERHNFPSELTKNIAAIEILATKAAE